MVRLRKKCAFQRGQPCGVCCSWTQGKYALSSQLQPLPDGLVPVIQGLLMGPQWGKGLMKNSSGLICREWPQITLIQVRLSLEKNVIWKSTGWTNWGHCQQSLCPHPQKRQKDSGAEGSPNRMPSATSMTPSCFTSYLLGSYFTLRHWEGGFLRDFALLISSTFVKCVSLASPLPLSPC